MAGGRWSEPSGHVIRRIYGQPSRQPVYAGRNRGAAAGAAIKGMRIPILLAAIGFAAVAQTKEELTRRLNESVAASAGAMARRDFTAFRRYVASDAIFLERSGDVLRGADAIGARWKSYVSAPEAPFSRNAETVHVAPSGTIALVTGPVHDRDGKAMDTFNSVWRRERDGSWKLVFDYACPSCNCSGAAEPQGDAGAVWRSEVAFAKSMADRDLGAFRSHVAEDAVFMARTGPLLGREEVVKGWTRFFEGPKAPFSWAPDRVLVLDSGGLALSQGPVLDPSGKRASTFSSIWRKEADGNWRVVLDKGCPACTCPGGGD